MHKKDVYATITFIINSQLNKVYQVVS